ncbi:MAG: flagellar hook-associated protein FlgK [Nocardioidaceae bacterium]
MPGTFSSLNTALSALRYNQVALDVASGNVANVGTPGYARRQVVGQATGAPSTPAIWSRWQGAGDGVEAGPVTRMVDPLLDARVRTEHATGSFLDTQSTALVRFETTLNEPGDNGIAAALANFKAGWQDVANNPNDGAARSQLIARANTLATALNDQSRAVTTEWDDQGKRLTALATDVTQTAQSLDRLNDGLRTAYVSGTDAGNLLDQRDQLALHLSELTGADVKINDDTTMTVKLGNSTLVDGSGQNDPLAMTVTAGGPGSAAQVGASSPVQVSVGAEKFSTLDGSVGGTLQLMNGDLPGFLGKLDGVAAQLAHDVNDGRTNPDGTVTGGQANGLDEAGNAGRPVFVSSDGSSTFTAASISVDPTFVPEDVAAAGKAGGLYDNTNALDTAALDMGDEAYRSLVTDFGVTVSKSKQLASNQQTLVAQVDASRESLSGISVDEEMVNVLAAQKGYAGAARVMTAVDEMLDTLINKTGLVGR